MSHRHTMQKRHRTTVWLNRDLWQQFMEKAREHHLSTCLVLEALMSAYLYGGSVVPGQDKPQVVNITIEREEMRPRRREDEKYVRREPPAKPIPRKWSARRVPRDARCIGCRHHERQAEYNPSFQGLLIYHWCSKRGLPLCDVPDDVLRTCELREV